MHVDGSFTLACDIFVPSSRYRSLVAPVMRMNNMGETTTQATMFVHDGEQRMEENWCKKISVQENRYNTEGCKSMEVLHLWCI